ncbi:MAG: DUF6503 family protein [Bacteroidota bacterium]
MKYPIYAIVGLCFIAACSQTQNQEEENSQAVQEYTAPQHHSASLTAVFDAHGGFENWASMKHLSYVKGEEKTITNLQNRKIRIESPSQTIGYNGKDVWVLPDSIDASRARFYHNLYFYFYAMPFVVGDPGAIYEDVPEREIKGKSYKGIKVSYEQNIGDAPDDNYILWYDPVTNQMEWLMYTVTYGKEGPSDKYSLIQYGGWTSFDGLQLPTSLQWHQFANDEVGGPRGNPAIFEEVMLSDEAPGSTLFEMPEGAQVAPAL